ncbi:hypothetical protein GBAR_LOCUS12831, partial [Geodia barretti]
MSVRPRNDTIYPTGDEEQEMLLGRSSLCPERSSLSRVVTGTPAYGTPPHVNTSQHVTPNDHYEKGCPIVILKN